MTRFVSMTIPRLCSKTDISEPSLQVVVRQTSKSIARRDFVKNFSSRRCWGVDSANGPCITELRAANPTPKLALLNRTRFSRPVVVVMMSRCPLGRDDSLGFDGECGKTGGTSEPEA